MHACRLAGIFKQNSIKSVTVVNMEVPYCFGLYRLVKEALVSTEKNVPLKQETINIKGDKILSLHEHHELPVER